MSTLGCSIFVVIIEVAGKLRAFWPQFPLDVFKSHRYWFSAFPLIKWQWPAVVEVCLQGALQCCLASCLHWIALFQEEQIHWSVHMAFIRELRILSFTIDSQTLLSSLPKSNRLFYWESQIFLWTLWVRLEWDFCVKSVQIRSVIEREIANAENPITLGLQ